MEGFLRYEFGGLILIFWRGLYMEGLIFRILKYITGSHPKNLKIF